MPITDSEKKVLPAIRSEEVQELISHVPHGLLRWGLTVIFAVISLLLGVTWFIQYPDILYAHVIITTSPAPVNLVTRASGKVTLVKRDNESCIAGDIIGYIQTNADLKSVQVLEDRLRNGKSFEAAETLGDLQVYYSAWVKAMQDLKIYTEQAAYAKQIDQLKRQMNTYQKLGNALRRQSKLSKQEQLLALQKFKTDSLLYVQNVIAALDFNQSKSNWLQQQRTTNNFEVAVYNNDLQLSQLQKQISELVLQQSEDADKLTLALNTAQRELMNQIKRWKENFLITAPADGKIAYLGFIEDNTFVEAGRNLFSVIPKAGTLVGQAELPITGSGKVQAGQRVNIRLDNYPYEQYGALTGRIASISVIPNEQKYFITLEIPQQLVTSQRKTIQFRQKLSGSTQIITEELRLLERFVYEFRRLVNSRK